MRFGGASKWELDDGFSNKFLNGNQKILYVRIVIFKINYFSNINQERVITYIFYIKITLTYIEALRRWLFNCKYRNFRIKDI